MNWDQDEGGYKKLQNKVGTPCRLLSQEDLTPGFQGETGSVQDKTREV